MKGNEKGILIGAVVLALLLVGGSFKFFYLADQEKADQVQTEINGLKSRMEELNEKNANRSLYESGIANSSDIIDTVLSLYGPGNTTEKTIMMIVDLCNKTGIQVDDISFEDDSLIYATGGLTDDEQAESIEGESLEERPAPDVQIFKSGISMSISSGYTQMKKLTDYINSYPERMNAEDFTISFSGETGRLIMSMTVNMYSVIDKNHTYVAPVIEDIDLGTTNIFRTMEVIEEETEEGAEETVAEPTDNDNVTDGDESETE